MCCRPNLGQKSVCLSVSRGSLFHQTVRRSLSLPLSPFRSDDSFHCRRRLHPVPIVRLIRTTYFHLSLFLSPSLSPLFLSISPGRRCRPDRPTVQSLKRETPRLILAGYANYNRPTRMAHGARGGAVLIIRESLLDFPDCRLARSRSPYMKRASG